MWPLTYPSLSSVIVQADSEFALKLAQDLKDGAGANVWLDQLDIELGTAWDLAVEEALNRSPCLLVVLSPISVASQNVRDEISFALSKQKRVIPLLAKDCEIPFRLARLQHADFRSDYSLGLKALMKALVSQDGVHAHPPSASGTIAQAVAAEEGLGQKAQNVESAATQNPIASKDEPQRKKQDEAKKKAPIKRVRKQSPAGGESSAVSAAPSNRAAWVRSHSLGEPWT